MTEKSAKPERPKVTTHCLNCGEEAQVNLPLFCDQCYRMVRRRRIKQESPQIQHHENVDPKHRVVVYDRSWVKEPGKQ